jgi:hypothetical protein
MLPLLGNLLSVSSFFTLLLELIKVHHDLSFLLSDYHLVEHFLSVLVLVFDVFLTVVEGDGRYFES